MPIEIRELVIRAVVSDDGGRAQRYSPGVDGNDRNELIEACVKEVLRVLRRSGER